MGRKVFEVQEDRPPVRPEFELGGEVFVCKTDADVSSLDVLDAIDGLTGEDGLQRLKTMLRVFREWIPPDDGVPAIMDKDDPTKEISPGEPSSMERFRNVIRGKRVTLETLNDIASWVVNEYLRFPTETEPDGPSSNGSTAAASSNAAGSSPAPALTSTS
jgi:hypothetical protein